MVIQCGGDHTAGRAIGTAGNDFLHDVRHALVDLAVLVVALAARRALVPCAGFACGLCSGMIWRDSTEKLPERRGLYLDRWVAESKPSFTPTTREKRVH